MTGGVDFSAFIPIIAKSGAATIVLALLFGLSYVITAWRGGSVSEKKQNETVKELTEIKARLSTAELAIDQLTSQVYDTRYQRDQARVRVEYLEQKYDEQPRTIYPADPPRGNV